MDEGFRRNWKEKKLRKCICWMSLKKHNCLERMQREIDGMRLKLLSKCDAFGLIRYEVFCPLELCLSHAHKTLGINSKKMLAIPKTPVDSFIANNHLFIGIVFLLSLAGTLVYCAIAKIPLDVDSAMLALDVIVGSLVVYAVVRSVIGTILALGYYADTSGENKIKLICDIFSSVITFAGWLLFHFYVPEVWDDFGSSLSAAAVFDRRSSRKC